MNEAKDGGTVKVRRANLRKGYETEKWETVYAGMRAQGKTIAQAKAEAWALVDSVRRAEAIPDRDATLDKVFAESAGADMVAAAQAPSAESLAWTSKGQAEYCEGCSVEACNVILKPGETCGDRVEADPALAQYIEANTDPAEPIAEPEADEAPFPGAVNARPMAQLVRCPECGMAMIRNEACAYCGASYSDPEPAEEFDAAIKMAGKNKAKRAAKRAGRKAPKKAKAPSEVTVARWMEKGSMKATDGCKVEDDGHCEHGCPSWALELGLI